MAEDARVCSPSGAPGGWCAREAADCAARCALEVEYAAEGSHLEAGDSSAFSFNASLTVVNNEAASLRAWQATWAFAEGEGVARDAAFATDVAVLVSPGGPGGQPARLVNALGEGGAVPPAGRRTFAFKGVASGVSTAPRSVARVHLNGARCVAIQEPPSSRVELEEPDERSSFASGHDDDVHDDVETNEPQTGVSFASCPPDAVSFFRFCCGDALETSASERVSSSSQSDFVFRGAAADAVVSAALLAVAGALVLAALARAARALLAARHRTNARSRLRSPQAGLEPETQDARRKTTAFLPGQIASAPAADRDGVVVRSNGDDRFCLFPERLVGALSSAIAVGRDGRDAAVGRDRVVETRRPAASAPSLATPDSALDVARDVERRRGDSSDASSDAESAESAESADDADAIVAVALSELELGDVLGRGAYGVVRRGVWTRKARTGGLESDVEDADAAESSAEDGLPVAKKNDAARLRGSVSTRVAVKTLRAARLGARPSRGALRAFKREVAVLSRLRHPCVVRLLGACLAPPDLCIVEELVEGGSLHSYLHGPGARRGAGDEGSSSLDAASETRARGAFAERASRARVSTALDVCSDVARAMAYLAARGVTHRDLKSQNVLLVFPERAGAGVCGDGGNGAKRGRLRAKVADFGIAKSRDDCAGTGAEAFLVTNGTTGVITGGGAAGTPAWMAPELFRDNAPVAGEASDAYSFGVVLWECLTGKTPWGWLRDPLQIVFAVAVEGKRLPFPLIGGMSEDAKDAKTPKKNAAAETEKGEDGFFLSGAEEATRVFFRALLERCWAEDPRARPGFEEIGEVLRGLRASVPRAGEARAEP